MTNSLCVGKRGEDEATQFLLANGYVVLDRNWRWKRFEIDIIARKDNTLVFVEVKLRKDEKFGYPEEFVSDAQQERIAEAAEEYCDRTEWKGELRFDIISILENKFPDHLEHFEGAF